jgi:hypothetical protein
VGAVFARASSRRFFAAPWSLCRSAMD